MTRGIMVGHIDEPAVDTDAARRDILAAIARGDLTQADVDNHCRRIFYYIYKLRTPRSPNPLR